jgi:predicted O-linked N-acetylglucosamine transferase (SPINDLY family)
MIRRDQIDILVDLAMHTAGNRLLVFARKPAPVQVSYLAYAGSTGLEAMDYRLSDSYLEPPDEIGSAANEQTARLRGTYWCYRAREGCPAVSALPALERGRITFGCLNNFCKVNDRVLELWATILQAVPKSQLLLHAHEGKHRQHVLDRMAAAGIASDRVTFAAFAKGEKYWDLYRYIDVALDTFPFAGGTTTCDALWMGVPVVSLAGKTAVGRAGLSLLSHIGLAELVGKTEADYAAIATKLSTDLSRLGDWRQTLRPRMAASPIMNAGQFARDVEETYRAMWRRWCGKEKSLA